MATVTSSITTEELLAMPEDGIDRWIVAGELKERPMTVRNRFHSRVMICIGTELENWLRQQPEPRGQVLAGDAGVRLQRDPDTTFGVDVVYASAELLARQHPESTIIDGVPTLAVEILSPSNTIEDLNEKIDALLNAGTPLIWILDPHWRTVTIHQPGEDTALLSASQDLTGEPHLPGFRVAVKRLFE